MHTLQYIAIQAEDKESAAHTVETLLNEELNPGHSWYDWFVVGGGRFAKSEDPYQDTFETVIAYEDSPLTFEKIVAECVEKQLAEFQELLTEYKQSETNLVELFDNYKGGIEFSMTLYPVKKMIDIMQGAWDYTCRFYDLNSWSSDTHHMNRSLADGNKNWFLVPIDFHF